MYIQASGVFSHPGVSHKERLGEHTIHIAFILFCEWRKLNNLNNPHLHVCAKGPAGNNISMSLPKFRVTNRQTASFSVSFIFMVGLNTFIVMW